MGNKSSKTKSSEPEAPKSEGGPKEDTQPSTKEAGARPQAPPHSEQHAAEGASPSPDADSKAEPTVDSGHTPSPPPTESAPNSLAQSPVEGHQDAGPSAQGDHSQPAHHDERDESSLMESSQPLNRPHAASGSNSGAALDTSGVSELQLEPTSPEGTAATAAARQRGGEDLDIDHLGKELFGSSLQSPSKRGLSPVKSPSSSLNLPPIAQQNRSQRLPMLDSPLGKPSSFSNQGSPVQPFQHSQSISAGVEASQPQPQWQPQPLPQHALGSHDAHVAAPAPASGSNGFGSNAFPGDSLSPLAQAPFQQEPPEEVQLEDVDDDLELEGTVLAEKSRVLPPTGELVDENTHRSILEPEDEDLMNSILEEAQQF